eukprot:1139173-Pelagomonas_calceolata.AAC.3
MPVRACTHRHTHTHAHTHAQTHTHVPGHTHTHTHTHTYTCTHTHLRLVQRAPGGLQAIIALLQLLAAGQQRVLLPSFRLPPVLLGAAAGFGAESPGLQQGQKEIHPSGA